MNILSFLMLFGGLALFLYGMKTMSSALEQSSGGKLREYLKKFSSSKIKGVGTGALITMIIQSSSATTVMLTGLVNSGIMTFHDTVSVIIGSNIGTTLTPWITSSVGVGEGNILLSLLKPSSLAFITAVSGMILIMSKKHKSETGYVLLGFSILMTGMSFMSQATAPIGEIEGIEKIFIMFENPFFGILAGAFISALIQSSTASVAILQSLAVGIGISYKSAIPIIMGQNIGTCITSLIAGIGANRQAKKVSVVHILFNIIGTAVILFIFYILNAIFSFDFVNRNINGIGIAAVHTLFNLLTCIIVLPISKYIEKIADKAVGKKGENQNEIFIDERLLLSPSVAIFECENMAKNMCSLSVGAVNLSIGNIFDANDKVKEKIFDMEEKTDIYEDIIGTFLVKLSQKRLSFSDGGKSSKILHTIGDFERIADHSVNICKISDRIKNEKIIFSDEAKKETEIISSALFEIISSTSLSFISDDAVTAKDIEPLEEAIDTLIAKAKTNHISRLQLGYDSIDMGLIYSELLINFERISDHCSNIAVSVIETKENSFETHKYLNSVKANSDEYFNKKYKFYSEKYKI